MGNRNSTTYTPTPTSTCFPYLSTGPFSQAGGVTGVNSDMDESLLQTGSPPPGPPAPLPPKVAVVTGANKGIGFGIVKALLMNGPRTIVYLTARDEARGLAAVEKLKFYGFKLHFHQLDISNMDSINKFANFIRETHGGLDILVNNAGIAFSNNAQESFAEQAETSIRINFFGTLNVCHALFPLLRPGARVVNVSSSLGLLPKINGLEPHSGKLRAELASKTLTEDQLCEMMNDFVLHAETKTHYAAGWPNSTYAVSKVGVAALTRIQQRDLDAAEQGKGRDRDILVNSVHPGYVATDMNNHNGELTIDQGAEAPAWLALLPAGHNDEKARGGFAWRNKEFVDWENGVTPTPY